MALLLVGRGVNARRILLDLLNTLMPKYFARPYDHTTAGFYLTICAALVTMVIDAEGCTLGRYSRSVLRRCCDNMLVDFAAQRDLAGHPN